MFDGSGWPCFTKDELRQLIEAQCEVEAVTEDAVSITGPLDLEELAGTLNYLMRHPA